MWVFMWVLGVIYGIFFSVLWFCASLSLWICVCVPCFLYMTPKAAPYMYIRSFCFLKAFPSHVSGSVFICGNEKRLPVCVFAPTRRRVDVCPCVLTSVHACTHAAASVFIICACALWRSGESTEGFPQRPRCRSVCSVKGEDHLPGLGEISATCRCWGIYPSTQGNKTKQGVGGSRPTESRVFGLENSDLMVKCSMHNLKVCHTFFFLVWPWNTMVHVKVVKSISSP